MPTEEQIRAVIDELEASGVETRGFVRAGDKNQGTYEFVKDQYKEPVRKALEAGMDGPTIVAFVKISGSAAHEKLLEEAESRLALRKRQAEDMKQKQEEAEKDKVRISVGLQPNQPVGTTTQEQGGTGKKGDVQLSNLYVEYSKKIGGVMTPAEVAASVQDGYLSLSDILKAVTASPAEPRGFAPQAKVQGVLPKSGHPYLIDPNTNTLLDLITGLPPTSADFAELPKQQIDGRTGNLILISSDGKVTDTGQKIGFPEIDPAKTAAEQVRQFEVSEAGTTARSAADREAANQRAMLAAQSSGFNTLAGLVPSLATVAQNQAQFQRDVIASPADLAYRMFTTRGGTSPFPRVTQADLANNLAAEIARYNQVLKSYQPGTVGFTPPAPTPAPISVAAPVVPPAPPTPSGFTQTDAALPPTITTFTPPEGTTVSPAQGLAGFLALNPGFKAPTTGVFAELPNVTPPQAVAPTVAAPPPAPVPSFAIPEIPLPPTVTQEQLKGFEAASRPPAVSSILQGQMPKALDLGFSLPTPQMYGSLTPDERKAFGSTLAIQYDVAPEDYETAIKQRFAAPAERRAARTVGF